MKTYLLLAALTVSLLSNVVIAWTLTSNEAQVNQQTDWNERARKQIFDCTKVEQWDELPDFCQVWKDAQIIRCGLKGNGPEDKQCKVTEPAMKTKLGREGYYWQPEGGIP